MLEMGEEEHKEEGANMTMREKGMAKITETFNFTQGKKVGLVAKYTKGKAALAELTFMLDKVCDTAEKMKKLLTWEDPATSQKIMFLILGAFLVVSFIPIRLIACIGLIEKFNKGSKYYKRKYIGNKECCRIEMRNFFFVEKNYTFADLFEDTSTDPFHEEKEELKESHHPIYVRMTKAMKGEENPILDRFKKLLAKDKKDETKLESWIKTEWPKKTDFEKLR